jgi:hypothetical protein
MSGEKPSDESARLDGSADRANAKGNGDISRGHLQRPARYDPLRIFWLGSIWLGLWFLSASLHSSLCLGVEVISVAPDSGIVVRVHEGQGIMVGDPEPGSPAELAGLEPGDVILEFGEHQLFELGRSPLELYRLIRESPVEEPIALLIRRGEHIFEATIRLRLSPRLGISFNSHDGPGFLVREVAEDSLAKAVGIRKGDIILEYGETAFRGTNNQPMALAVAITRSPLNVPIRIVLLRNSRELGKTIRYGTPSGSMGLVPGEHPTPTYLTLMVLEAEASARFVDFVTNLIDPLKAMLSAREELRELTAQSQTFWSAMLADLDAAESRGFDLEEEAQLRAQALPILARAARESDRALMRALDQLREMVPPTSSRPLSADQLQAALEVDALMGQAEIHASVESQAVSRLEAMRRPLLDRHPEWAGAEVPGTEDLFGETDSLGVLLSKIEAIRKEIYRDQARVDKWRRG